MHVSALRPGPRLDQLRTPANLQRLGIIGTAGAVSVWGVASVLVKSVDGIGGVGIAFYRLLFGVVLLSTLHLLRGGRISWRMLVLCAPGGIALGTDMVFFFSALRETSVANATVIGALQPILLLPVGVRLFGERVDRRVVLWSVVSVAGTAVVVLGASGVPEWSLRGDLLAMGALCSWTAYFIASKRARAALGAFEYFTGLTIVSLVVVAPFALATGADLSPAAGGDWAAILGITVFSGALGHVLLNWSHAHVPLQVMSLLTLLVPVVATAGAVAFLGESLRGLQVAGMVVVLGSLAEVVRRTSTPEAVPAPPVAPVGDLTSE